MPTKGLTKNSRNKFSILNGSKYFYSRILQNKFSICTGQKYIKYFCGNTRINYRKINGMSEENIEKITKADSNFAPLFDYLVLLRHKF